MREVNPALLAELAEGAATEGDSVEQRCRTFVCFLVGGMANENREEALRICKAMGIKPAPSVFGMVK